jgi:hypothetical protein
MMPSTLRASQRVVVTGAAGVCVGEVLTSETPATLPELVDAPRLTRILAILAQWGISEIATIAHQRNGRLLMFVALRHADGGWRDLRDRPLSITPVPGGAEN